jgi:tetratricopeptide (TPR) repeat protein
MIRLGFAMLLFLSCLIVPLSANAQTPVTLAGNVYYEDDYSPAKNVVISLSDVEQVQLTTQATSDDGGFRFRGLMRSTYTVSINASGYETITLTVDLSFSSDKVVAIYLKRSSEKQVSPKASTISMHELSIPAKARELMESGKKKLYQDKDPGGGLADFQQALSVAPGYYEAHYQVAMAYLTLGNPEEAEKSLRKSVEVSGDKYGAADVGLGTVMLDRGSFSEGEKTIRRGLQLNPNLWLGHYELGRALLNEKRISEAQDSAEHARLLAPRAPMVYRLLSNIHLQEKDYPALLKDIDAYLTLDPDSPAGIRAKQLREQVQQKIGSEHPAPASAEP